MPDKTVEINEAGRVGASVDVVADYLGLTARRVQQLEKSRGNLRWARGLYDLQGFVRSYCDYLRADDRSSASSERTRLLAAQAEKTEIEVDEKKGELVSAAAVRAEQFGLMRILRNNLQSMPDRITALVAAEGDPRLVHKLISGEVDRSLRGIIAKLEGEAVDDDVLDVNRREAVEHISPEVIEDADAD